MQHMFNILDAPSSITDFRKKSGKISSYNDTFFTKLQKKLKLEDIISILQSCVSSRPRAQHPKFLQYSLLFTETEAIPTLTLGQVPISGFSELNQNHESTYFQVCASVTAVVTGTSECMCINMCIIHVQLCKNTFLQIHVQFVQKYIFANTCMRAYTHTCKNVEALPAQNINMFI